MSPTRVIIVGGGAIGLSLAWELSQRGVDVTLIERDEVGRATSWAASGILPAANRVTATDPIDQLRGLSHHLFPQWAERLSLLTGIDPGYRRCGAWYLADTPGERAAMIGMTDYWQELEIECRSVAPEEFVATEPALSQWVEQQHDLAAWWVPDECQVRCPSYLQALAVACRTSGVQIHEGHGVRDVAQGDGDGVTVTASAGQADRDFQGDAVVFCAGAWTGRVTPVLRLQQGLVPVRGQILLLKTQQPLFQPIVNVGHRYLVPRDDGHVLVGSCEEEVGFQCETTQAMIDTLRSFAFEICPDLQQATEVAAWSGLRPLTFDGFPMIGRVPDTTNLFVAAGHFRSGIHLSPATAVCLADLITGTAPAVDLDPFRVGKKQHSMTETVARSPA
jgi:glycine oxidase